MENKEPTNQVIVNGQPMSKEEFEKKKQEVAQTPGMKLVESGPNQYRTKLEE